MRGAEFVVQAAVVGFRQHAGFFQQTAPAFIAAKGIHQTVEAFGRIADAEGGDALSIHAAALEIGFGFVRGRQLFLEILAAGFQSGIHVAAAVGVGRARVFRNFDTGTLGQILDRIHEGQPVVVHQETDGGALGAAAEAVIELFARRDRERGRTLVVERAARRVILALFLQRQACADNFDQIDARQQVVDEGFRELRHQIRMPSFAGCRAHYFDSAALTMPDTAPMSARPASCGFSAAMTLPMACGPSAPVSAMALATSASTSAWLSGCGR